MRSDTELALGAFLPDMGAMCWRDDGTAPGSGRAGWAIVGAIIVALVAAAWALATGGA
jgi:hypothetical protein